MSAPIQLSYWIDESDRIQFIDESWVLFAHHSGEVKLASAEHVLGRSLWEFIVDQDVIKIYRTILSFVRAKEETVKVPFRCDSPNVMRRMILTCSPLPNKCVLFESNTIEEKLTDHHEILEPGRKEVEKFLFMCSWCKAIQLTADYWASLEEAIQYLNIFESPRLPRISHGVCPKCYEGVIALASPVIGNTL